MAPWTDTTAVLDDPQAAFLPDGGPATFYCWPVWRFGRVLQPNADVRLEVEIAQKIGSLFAAGQPAAQRYLSERISEWQRLATDLKGQLHQDWPSNLTHRSEACRELERTWRPQEILVTYSFVPIIRLPRVVLELGESTWLVRESLTICGYPAKSKTWITASLIAYKGQTTDETPLSKADLDAVRGAVDAFIKSSLAGLILYYLKVLNQDTGSLQLEKPLHVRELEPLAETEIVSLASNVDLRDALEVLEEKGFQRFRSEASEGLFPGALEALDFLEWTEQTGMPGGGEWQPGRPKVLAIYAEQPACGSVRALVLPKIGSAENRTWYAALTELKQVEDQPTRFPLSESAGRFLATEYGRYF